MRANTNMSIKESLVDDAFHYLEICGIKSKILKYLNEGSSENDKENFPGSLSSRRFSLLLDVITLSDISVPLVQLMLINMESAEKIFLEAFQRIIEAVREVKSSVSNNSPDLELEEPNNTPLFHLSLQLQRIPRNLFSNSTHDITLSAKGRLIFFRGIVFSFTPLLKHKKHLYNKKTYHEDDEGTGKNYLWSTASSCSSVSVEISGENNVDTFIEVVFIPIPEVHFGSESSHCMSHLSRGILVRFYDDLASDIKLGEEYDIAALKAKEGMKGYYLQKIKLDLPLNPFTNLKVTSILSLKESMRSSPWAFFIALASQISFGLYPDLSFLNLKEGLLLSLASLGSGGSPIPIFAVGPEFIPAHRLMMHASRLVSKRVTHSVKKLITGNVRWQEDKFGKNSMWVNAGSLILSQGGVCYIGNWDKYKNETKSAIQIAIEKREIIIPTGKTDPVSNLKFPLKCAVWLYGNIKKSDKIRPLIDIFGIPFMLKLDSQEEEQVINLILQNSYNDFQQANNFRVEAEELKMITKSFKASLGTEAAQLIQDYFVASRRCRGMGDNKECLPIRAVDIITQMAEAHARLNLHSTVTLEDALVAISICEEAISAIYGNTSMSAPPPLRIKENTSTNFIKEVDNHMKQFDRWLRRFIRDLIGENFSDLTKGE